VKYIVKKENLDKFEDDLIRLAEMRLCKQNRGKGIEDLDNTLSSRLCDFIQIEKSIDEFNEEVKTACNEPFKKIKGIKESTRK
jgi:hypothetical protein